MSVTPDPLTKKGVEEILKELLADNSLIGDREGLAGKLKAAGVLFQGKHLCITNDGDTRSAKLMCKSHPLGTADLKIDVAVRV